MKSSNTSRRRHAYGQHFLKEKRTIDIITNCAVENLEKFLTTSLLEIGPGKGALTLPLITKLSGEQRSGLKGREFWAYEKDIRLQELWNSDKELFAKALPSFRFQLGDFLLREADFLRKRSFSWIIVSNLPYSVGTPILESLIEEHLSNRIRIEAMILMFQKEVADRITAEIPSRGASSLTLFVQNHFEVSTLCKVAPGAFSPPPQVWSEVLVLKPLKKPRIQRVYLGNLESLVRQAFQQRRKMLRSVFKSDSKMSLTLEKLQLGHKRAEALDWNEWNLIAQELS